MQLFKVHYLDVINWEYKTIILMAESQDHILDLLPNAEPETLDIYYCASNQYDITRS